MTISNKQKIKLGLFIIGSTILLIASLYLIGREQHVFGSSFEAHMIFTHVKGLKEGNNVRYAGINMGTVKSVVLINDSLICVTARLNKDLKGHLKKNVLVRITSDGLVGSRVIDIKPGSGDAPLIKEGDTLFAEKEVVSQDLIRTLQNTNNNLSVLSEELLKITRSVNKGEGTLGRLLYDEKMAMDLKSIIVNVQSASQSLKSIANDFEPTARMLSRSDNVLSVLIADSVAANDLRSTFHHVEKSAVRLESALQATDQLMTSVNESEGMIDLFVNDTTLVQDVKKTVEELRSASELLHENMKALQQNKFMKRYLKKMEDDQQENE